MFCVAILVVPYFADGADDSKQKPDAPTEEEIYNIGGDVNPPKLIHVVEPSFNAKSEEAFVSGAIKLQIIVTKAGVVRDAKVVSGANERQNKSAVDAVLQWRFKPAVRKGEAVSVRATVEVTFHLL
jgi:protein TonB